MLGLGPRAHTARHRPVAVRVAKVFIEQRRVGVVDGITQLLAYLATRGTRFEDTDTTMELLPCDLGVSYTGDGRPIGVEDREHAARPKDASRFTQGCDRLHPMHRLHGDHHVGTVRREAGVARCAVSIRDPRSRASLGSGPHISVGLDTDHLTGPRCRPPRGEPRSTTKVDDTWRRHGGIRCEQGTDRVRGSRAVGVVQVGETGEAIEVAVPVRTRLGVVAHVVAQDGVRETTSNSSSAAPVDTGGRGASASPPAAEVWAWPCWNDCPLRQFWNASSDSQRVSTK